MNDITISIQKMLARVKKYEHKRSKYYYKLHKRARKLSYNIPSTMVKLKSSRNQKGDSLDMGNRVVKLRTWRSNHHKKQLYLM